MEGCRGLGDAIRHVLQLHVVKMVFVIFESRTCLYNTYDKILKEYGD